VSLYVLAPGEPMGMYHWEADQEDFFVLAGEALLLVEGEERPLREWDFVHCPPSTDHIIVGAGDARRSPPLGRRRRLRTTRCLGPLTAQSRGGPWKAGLC
jgi:Cupin domain